MKPGRARHSYTGHLPFIPGFLHRLTIAQRVRIGFAMGAAVVVAVGLVASLVIRITTDTLNQAVNEVHIGQQTTTAVKDALSAENAAVQGYLITTEPSYLDKFNSAHDRFVAAAGQFAGATSAADRQTAAAVLQLEQEFRRTAQAEIDLSREGFPGSAAFHWQTEGQQAEETLRTRLDDLVAQKQANLQDILSGARHNDYRTRFLFAPLVGLTAALGILTAFIASRSITVRIERLEETIERIESGDFQVEFTEHSHDELGKLGRSIQNMARTLETETRERDQLLGERARANEELSALYDVARTVNQSLDHDEVLRLALARLLSHTHMRAGLALLRAPETGRFGVTLVDGLDEETAVEVAGFMEEDEAQQWVDMALQREGITRLDLKTLPFGTQPFRTAVAVPLRAKGNDLGVLILATAADKAFSEAEGRLVEGLAKQIGTALEHARLYSQSRQLAVAEERNRLARDLHDSVTQSLFSMSMMAQALPSLIERNPGRAGERAARLSDLARGALAEMRMLILELRPAALQEMGLVMALERHVAGFASRESLEATFRVEGLQRRLPPEHEEALFRVVQEALNNVARHASAKSVSVVLEFEPADARVTVADDGGGLPDALPLGGFGLISMRERMERLGGSLLLEGLPERGCQLVATAPVPAATTSITAMAPAVTPPLTGS